MNAIFATQYLIRHFQLLEFASGNNQLVKFIFFSKIEIGVASDAT